MHLHYIVGHHHGRGSNSCKLQQPLTISFSQCYYFSDQTMPDPPGIKIEPSCIGTMIGYALFKRVHIQVNAVRPLQTAILEARV
jgi:hypothetical protein